jgi:hypothetical protein
MHTYLTYRQNVCFSPTNQQKNYTLFLKMQYAVQNTENYDTYEIDETDKTV